MSHGHGLEGLNAVGLNPNPLANSNCMNGWHQQGQGKPQTASFHHHGAIKALATNNANSTLKLEFSGDCFACGKKSHISHYCPSEKTDHAAATVETNKTGAAIYHACAACELCPAPNYISSPCSSPWEDPLKNVILCFSVINEDTGELPMCGFLDSVSDIPAAHDGSWIQIL